MDETAEKDGWLFGRKGSGYIAVRSMEPACWNEKDPDLFRSVWPDSWEERYRAARDYEYTAQGHANVWVVEMGSEAENGSFTDFMSRFASAGLEGDTHRFTYDSPSLGRMRFGWSEPLTVEGKEIPLHGYMRYDTPYCRAEFGAARYEISCGGADAVLDFARHERIV